MVSIYQKVKYWTHFLMYSISRQPKLRIPFYDGNRETSNKHTLWLIHHVKLTYIEDIIFNKHEITSHK